MAKPSYFITGLVCLATFFLLMYFITVTEDINHDNIHRYEHLMKVNFTKQRNTLHTRLNTSLNEIVKVDVGLPSLNLTQHQHTYLSTTPPQLLPGNLPVKVKFPIRTPTFDIGLSHNKTISNKEMTKYILGQRAEAFYKNGSDKLVMEVQPKTFDYIINNKILCRSATSLEFVLSVYTAPKNFEERSNVRQSWGRLSLLPNHTSRTVFFLGAVADPNLQEKILNESKTHGDIIQTSFIDSYHNLSYKGISQLAWFRDFCSNTKYLVKADDDLYVDIFQVVKTIKALKSVDRFIIGTLYTGSQIMRGGRHKWTVQRHLMPGHGGYPPYYLGWIYILPNTVFKEMFQAAMATPVFHIDDVYITGLLASQLPDFNYLTFNGKVPQGVFMPGHPKLASMCAVRCKVPMFCRHMVQLGEQDREMIGATKLGDIYREEACRKLAQELKAKVNLVKEKTALEAKNKEEGMYKEKKAAGAKMNVTEKLNLNPKGL